MNKSLILLFFIFIMLSCNYNLDKEVINHCELPPIPYDVLYKGLIKTKDNLNYNIGVILLKKIPRDSLYKYCSYYQSMIKTCKIENLSYAEFYRNDDEPNDTVASLGKKTGLHGNFYIAKIDALKYGQKWKEEIGTKDINYYNPKNLPVIRPRLPALD